MEPISASYAAATTQYLLGSANGPRQSSTAATQNAASEIADIVNLSPAGRAALAGGIPPAQPGGERPSTDDGSGGTTRDPDLLAKATLAQSLLSSSEEESETLLR